MTFGEAHLAELIANGHAVDLGDEHWLSWFGWGPDRDLNPQYAGLPDIDRFGAQVWHRRSDGVLCCGAVEFDTPETAAVRAICPDGRPVWQVVSWEPLTLSPSLLCLFPLDDGTGATCGDHGFIRAGRWVRA